MSNEIPQPGSTISLVSNAQLRYEGTLELIKMGPEESSLSLSNVKSFGTEDRPTETGRYVPPNEVRFEYVVFKGTDIISLDVKEYYRGPPRQPFAPPPAPQTSTVSYPQPQTSVWGPPGPAPQQDNTWGGPGPASAPTSQQPTAPQYAQPSAPPAPQHAGQQAAAPAPTVVVTPSMAPRPQVQPRQQAPRQPAWSNARPASGPESHPQQPAPPPRQAPQPTTAHSQTRQAANNNSGGPPPGFSGPPPGIAPRRDNQGGNSNTRSLPPSSYAHAAGGPAHPSANGGEERGRGQGRGRARGRARGHQGRGDMDNHANGPPRAAPVRAPPVPVPNEDFNFEEALSKFDKDKIKEEADQSNDTHDDVPAAPQAYTKDDFFDALSSDLQDRLNTGERPQRRAFSEQRKVDMETFGGSGLAKRPMRGRGRGRGGRGRGRGRNMSPAVAVS